jgi:serine/threonine protein phosphatase PrpC
MKTLEKLGCTVDFASAPHERKLDKPNEDKLLIDGENGIFMVLDGVTRVHSEYEEMPFESAALKVGEIFMEQAYDYIKNHINDPDPKKILEGAVKVANEKIREYRSHKSLGEWVFYPSTLGILSILRHNTLHYICVGDCIAALLRGSSKILFGRQFSLEAVDLHKVSKSERYDIYCNHPENHLSYTVFNGDDEVNVGIEYSFIDLHEGDTLLLASDGIGNYIKYEKNADLVAKTADEMISLSKKYDLQPYADYADDKSIIKLSF